MIIGPQSGKIMVSTKNCRAQMGRCFAPCAARQNAEAFIEIFTEREA